MMFHMYIVGLTVFNIPPSCCNRTAMCQNVPCNIPTTDAQCLTTLKGVTKDTIPSGKVWSEGCSEAIIRGAIQKTLFKNKIKLFIQQCL